MEVIQGEWAANYQDSGAAEGFTRMEATYLLCVANGMTSKEAAQAVGRSQETVKKGLQRAYYRLGVTRAAAAVSMAQAKGWIRYAGKLGVCAFLALTISAGCDDAMRRGSRLHRITKREVEVQVHA